MMQNVLRMIGYGENLGSGFPLILDAMAKSGLPRPRLVEQPALLQVKLVLDIEYEPVEGYVGEPESEPKSEPEDEPASEPVSEPNVERERKIVSYISQTPAITRADMAEKLGVSLATVKRILARLQRDGKIGRDGGDKNGRWVVLPAADALPENRHL